MTPVHVAILIPTFRRPEGLARLLASLDALTFVSIAPPRITLVVVDNDGDTSAGPGDAAMPAAAARYPIIRAVEPVRGLSAARNRALELAPFDADFIAFIDDDEWAEPQWLEALIAMQAETGAEIVQGPVVPAFAAPAPGWMIAGGYYEVGPFAPGEALDFGATGNCLIARAALARTAVRFDMAYNHSGGEDADFFGRLLAAGCRIVAAPEARAHEDVPAVRMTMPALLRLQFRKGNTIGRMALATRDARNIAARAVKAFGWIVRGAVEALAFGLLVEGAAPRGLAGIWRGVGMLAAFARVRSRYYAPAAMAPPHKDAAR